VHFEGETQIPGDLLKVKMLVQKLCYLNSLAVALLLVCSGTRASAELEPVGLAVYTETARDIYIAALLLPPGATLENIYEAPGPRAMEFRIALRRISSRGFAGMLLLQAELGSGSRVPAQVVSAITNLKKNIKSALKQGDHLVITHTESDATSFVLNGVELLSVDDRSIFNFFLSGWIGRSSSTIFRDTLLSGNLDAGTLARFESLAPTDQRLATISSWVSQAPVPVPAPTLAPASTPQVSASTTAPAPVVNKKPVRKPEQIAKTVKTVADAEPTKLDDKEYQRQLNTYVTHIMKKVFGEVVYPRRAIKRQHEGKVELQVSLDPNGELLEVSVANSSGYDILDAAASKAVHKAAPFPELTMVAREEFLSEDGTSYIMPIPITFKLYN
jgi:protein TonB